MTMGLQSKQPFSVVITGEWPGAGQSTTASMLAKKLGFSRVYAGMLFRSFAYAWQIEKKRMSWQEFEGKVSNGELTIQDYQFKETDFNEQDLHEFQFQIKKSVDPGLWDKIIDRHSLLALSNPGVIVEAKVGVLLDKTKLLPNTRRKHKVFRFLLTCPPEISAHRVIKRKIENKELQPMDKESDAYIQLVRETTTETINRHLRDWERYEQIYGIYRSDIYRPGIFRVFTADKSQEEVVEVLLSIIEDKLRPRQMRHDGLHGDRSKHPENSAAQ
jgi:cytidylate kinase